MGSEQTLKEEQSASLQYQIEAEMDALGYSPSLEKLWNIDYDRIPVSIRQFVEDEYYLGRTLKELSDVWKKDLERIFDPSDGKINTVIFTGAIGTGKTTVSCICLLYKIYCLTCLKDPASFYGLLPKSRIVFGVFNITLTKADTGYNKLKVWIDDCPYFKEKCPRKTRPDEPIYFPSKNILVDVGSLDTHALGDDMFGFMMDEANFFKKSPDPQEKSRAHQLYSQARTRLVSRYMNQGRIPGIICLISSRKIQTSFIEEQIELVAKDQEFSSTTLVLDYPLWKTKSSSIYSGKQFSVLVGDEGRDSRILEQDEIVHDGRVVQVPVEYRPQFIEDLEGSLMNIAGVSCVGSFSFITQRSSIYNCIDSNRVHPFDAMELRDIGINRENIHRSSGRSIQDHLFIRRLCYIEGGSWRPILDPGVPRYAHVDIGLTGDALGLSVGHVHYDDSDVYSVSIDLVCKITAPSGEEVDLTKIIDFFVYLRNRGFNLDYITFDRFESRMAVQQLSRLGFRAGLLSIKLDHYKIVRRLLFEGRISYYRYYPLTTELADLRRSEKDGGRPNHPSGGHDDVADAFAGVVAHCTLLEKPKEVPPVRRNQVGAPIILGG